MWATPLWPSVIHTPTPCQNTDMRNASVIRMTDLWFFRLVGIDSACLMMMYILLKGKCVSAWLTARTGKGCHHFLVRTTKQGSENMRFVEGYFNEVLITKSKVIKSKCIAVYNDCEFPSCITSPDSETYLLNK